MWHTGQSQSDRPRTVRTARSGGPAGEPLKSPPTAGRFRRRIGWIMLVVYGLFLIYRAISGADNSGVVDIIGTVNGKTNITLNVKGYSVHLIKQITGSGWLQI